MVTGAPAAAYPGNSSSGAAGHGAVNIPGGQVYGGGGPQPPAHATPTHAVVANAEHVALLRDMGFDASDARRALEATNNLEAATELILSGALPPAPPGGGSGCQNNGSNHNRSVPPPARQPAASMDHGSSSSSLIDESFGYRDPTPTLATHAGQQVGVLTGQLVDILDAHSAPDAAVAAVSTQPAGASLPFTPGFINICS